MSCLAQPCSLAGGRAAGRLAYEPSLPSLEWAWISWGRVFSSWHSHLHLYVLWLLRQSMHSKCLRLSQAEQIIARAIGRCFKSLLVRRPRRRAPQPGLRLVYY